MTTLPSFDGERFYNIYRHNFSHKAINNLAINYFSHNFSSNRDRIIHIHDHQQYKTKLSRKPNKMSQEFLLLLIIKEKQGISVKSSVTSEYFVDSYIYYIEG